MVAVRHYHMTFLHAHKRYEKTYARSNRIFYIMWNCLSDFMLHSKKRKDKKYDAAYKYGSKRLLIGISELTANSVCNKGRYGKAWTLRKRDARSQGCYEGSHRGRYTCRYSKGYKHFIGCQAVVKGL